MTKEMQREFKAFSRVRQFWHKENTASHQDLAGLFAAKAVERYFKSGGRLAFAVPNSVIDRDYWGGFRRGAVEEAGVRFAIPWDLRRVRPHMFPRGFAVTSGNVLTERGRCRPGQSSKRGEHPGVTLPRSMQLV